MNKFAVLATVGWILNAYAFAAEGELEKCTLTNALYQLKSNPAITADFATIRYDERDHTAIRVHINNERSYRFMIEQGNGFFTYTNLLPISGEKNTEIKLIDLGPGGAPMHLYTVSREHEIRSELPKPADPAPAYLFMPGIEVNLYYLPNRFGRDFNNRDVLPRGFFELKSCRVEL